MSFSIFFINFFAKKATFLFYLKFTTDILPISILVANILVTISFLDGFYSKYKLISKDAILLLKLLSTFVF